MDNKDDLPQHFLEAIHKLVQLGASHQAISSALGLKLKVVQQLLAKDLSQVTTVTISEKSKNQQVQPSMLMTSPVIVLDGNYYEQSRFESDPSMLREMPNPKKEAMISEIRRLQVPQVYEVPTFIYSYTTCTDQLHRTNLVTGVHSSHHVLFQFMSGCCWTEVLGGSLIITGGGYPIVRDVVRIDVRREFAVSEQPPMLTPRNWHATVYHFHLYVLGGFIGRRNMSECERYVCADNRWDALPPLPTACWGSSGVVVENSLYALGGSDVWYLDLVQKLSLESLTWELMQLRLPYEGYDIPCFKMRDAEVYLVVKKTLCSFTALQVRPLKTLTEDICSLHGASYYRRGTLYCSYDQGTALSKKIGSLSS
jgi:hypothetical protein